jgi:DNA-binding LacI/PurR family transcriptional regulator
MSLENPDSSARLATYRRVAESLRDGILNRQFLPGQQLPSKHELMKTWHASSFTIHSALQALIREGWIESIRGAGTYVAQPLNRFVNAGIYHGADICSEEETPFLRRVHVSLLKKFRDLGKETTVFMDTRPAEAQHQLMPELAEAIRHRRIQCLVFPLANNENRPTLLRLKLPIASLSGPAAGMINFDMDDLFRQSLRILAGQGCRTVGLLSSYPGLRSDIDAENDFYQSFWQAVRTSGLTTKKIWVNRPAHGVPSHEVETRGYTAFKSFWKKEEKPDGLIVYPDALVRGVITAVLETGAAEVTRRMKFIFHRNLHLKFLCPLPAAWAISDEDAVAQALIDQIDRQFAGEKISPLLLPFSFQENPSLLD